jgi:hypothetical protein
MAIEQTTPTPSTSSAAANRGAGARMVTVVAGIWLFISAFLWPHSDASRANSWIVGLLMAGIALLATRTPSMRFVNTALAVWLFASTLTLFHVRMGTVWNNVIVAIVVLVSSLVSNRGGRTWSTPRRRVPA